MTSANKDQENSATNEPEKNENSEIALDPNPSEALTELVTGSETDTSTEESA